MFRNLRAEALGITASRESEKIELALTYGFRGMDLDLVEFSERVRASDLDHSRRLLEASNVRLGAFRLPFDVGVDEAMFEKKLAEFAPMAEVAGEVDCRRCEVIIKPGSNDRPFNDNFELHRARLSKIAEILAQHEIKLGLAFQAANNLRKDFKFEFIHDLDALLVLVNSVSGKNVGAVVDVWNLHSAGGSVEDLNKLTRDQIVSVWLADAKPDVAIEQADDESRLLPGETGAIDSLAAVKILIDMDYDGPVTPVPHRKRFQGMTRDVTVKMAGESMARIWRDAGLLVAVPSTLSIEDEVVDEEVDEDVEGVDGEADTEDED